MTGLCFLVRYSMNIWTSTVLLDLQSYIHEMFHVGVHQVIILIFYGVQEILFIMNTIFVLADYRYTTTQVRKR